MSGKQAKNTKPMSARTTYSANITTDKVAKFVKTTSGGKYVIKLKDDKPT